MKNGNVYVGISIMYLYANYKRKGHSDLQAATELTVICQDLGRKLSLFFDEKL